MLSVIVDRQYSAMFSRTLVSRLFDEHDVANDEFTYAPQTLPVPRLYSNTPQPSLGGPLITMPNDNIMIAIGCPVGAPVSSQPLYNLTAFSVSSNAVSPSFCGYGGAIVSTQYAIYVYMG